MSFLNRIFGYFVNEVLVQGLANNRMFQRFAVRSSQMVADMTKKSAEKQVEYSQKAQHFTKTFREEMKKGLDEQFKRGDRQP